MILKEMELIKSRIMLNKDVCSHPKLKNENFCGLTNIFVASAIRVSWGECSDEGYKDIII
jgi:hypothetical protein